MSEVLVRGWCVKVRPNGKVDVEFEYPGAQNYPVTVTLPVEMVLTPRLPGHLSDCDCWEIGKSCTCGAFVPPQLEA